MTDIVEELRNRTTGIVLLSAPPQFQKDGLCQQAADEILRLRAENEELRAALKPITDIKAFTCIFEWTPVEALRDDEKVHVKLTGAQIKAMRAAAALKDTWDEA